MADGKLASPESGKRRAEALLESQKMVVPNDPVRAIINKYLEMKVGACGADSHILICKIVLVEG